MSRCVNCDHWIPRVGLPKEAPAFGHCTSPHVKYVLEIPEAGPPENGMVLFPTRKDGQKVRIDPTVYNKEMLTGPHFGCVHHRRSMKIQRKKRRSLD